MTSVLVVFAVTVVATVAGTVLALEAQAWAPYLSRYLLRQAMARLQADVPNSLRDRWVEEIEADAASFGDRPLGGLVFCVRLWRKGGRELAGELALREAYASQSQAASPASTETLVLRVPHDGKIVTFYIDPSAHSAWEAMRTFEAMERRDPDE